MSSRREMSGIQQTMNRCKHFTGIQHKTCKALIPYERFRTPTGALQLPCFSDESSSMPCESAEWYTTEEAEVIEQEHRKAIHAFMTSITEGQCPICKIQVAHQQVGHCVYGSCGHRLYQGTVNPKFKAGA